MGETEMNDQVKQGDKAAFRKLVISYKPALKKFAYQFGLDTESISDAVQQTFNKAYEELDRFESGNFQAWLYKITVGVNRDFYKKNRTVEKSSSRAYYFESDAHLLLHESIHKLEEKLRLPIILFYFHDQSGEEIARILKTKSSKVNARLATARAKLENPEAALFHGLKDNYNLLPEYTNTDKIMNDLPVKKQKNRRWQLIPLAAIIIGFFLVFMFALPDVDQTEPVEKTPVEDTEEDKAIDEIELYAEEKKEAFRRALGVPSLEGFTEVDYVESLLNEQRFGNYTDEELMNMIDDIYITVPELVEEVKQATGEERHQKWQNLLVRYSNLEWSFSHVMRILLNEFPLTAAKQDELLENQYEYNGPIEYVEFLAALHKHGYKLYKNGSFLEVGSDYFYLANMVDYAEEDEGLRKLFAFLSYGMDEHYEGYSYESGDIPWYEFDEILLKMEDIYRSYPEIRNLIVSHGRAVQATTNYLNTYIHGGFRAANPDVKEILIEELTHFKENYPESVFTPVITQTLAEYKKADLRVNSMMLTHNAQFLFNNMESNLSYDTFYEIYGWPLVGNTERVYGNYATMKNEDILLSLTPFETLSLYTYAQEEDQELYEFLYAGEEEQERVDWSSSYGWAEVVLGNEKDDHTIEFSFVMMHSQELTNTITATVTLQNDGHSWKVIAEEEKDMDFW